MADEEENKPPGVTSDDDKIMAGEDTTLTFEEGKWSSKRKSNKSDESETGETAPPPQEPGETEETAPPPQEPGDDDKKIAGEGTLEKNTPTSEPGEENTPISEPGTLEKNTPTSEPGEENTPISEPVTTEKKTLTSEPGTTEKKTLTSEPGTTEKKTPTSEPVPKKEPSEETDKGKKIPVGPLFDSKGSLLQRKSFAKEQVEDVLKRKAEMEKELNELDAKVAKSKQNPTPEEVYKLKNLADDIMKKLSDYDSINKKVNQLMGLPDVMSSQLDLTKLTEGALPDSVSLSKKEEPKTDMKVPLPRLIDILDEKLPKIVVCGPPEDDPIPRIIVCEPLRKEDLVPFSKPKKRGDGGVTGRPGTDVVGDGYPEGGQPRPVLTDKLKAVEKEQKMASENAQMEKEKLKIQKDLIEKQEILDGMKKKMLTLQCENEELKKRLKGQPKDYDDDYPMCKRELYMKQKGNMSRPGACCGGNLPPPKALQRPMSPVENPVTPTFMCNFQSPTLMCDFDKFTSPICTNPFEDEKNRNRDNDVEKELDKMGEEVKNIYCELDLLQRDRLDYGCKKPPVCKRMLPQKSTQTDADKENDILFVTDKDPRFKDLTEQYKRLHNDFKNKVTEVAALRVDLDKTKSELESLTIIHHELEAMHQKEVDQNYMLNGEKNQLQACKDKIVDLEQQASIAKQLYNSCQDEMEETRTLIEEQATQLDDYRTKYMNTLQIAEELKRENEFKDRECADQLAVEIQKVKQDMQEQLEELFPIKDLLKITQRKLCETEQMHNVALETIADLSQRVEDATKEFEALKSQKKTDFDGEAAVTLAVSLEEAEKKLTNLENENLKCKEVIVNLESCGAARKQQLEEKAQEVLQLMSQLETVREESARQVARVKERSDMIRKCLQAQIAEMEKEVAQCRAATAFANRERDEIRSKLQLEICLLSDNFRESQNRIVQLQQHVNFLNKSHPTSFLNLIK